MALRDIVDAGLQYGAQLAYRNRDQDDDDPDADNYEEDDDMFDVETETLPRSTRSAIDRLTASW